ncbi:MAG TPA: LysM peptidoglycan-binding domain-containing protein [Terriglobales bacterium]|jgi:LysM repeat protein|nr:LysM peptidoglycan-binding domain-containing protein [Terriglobales bacterium]
MALERVNILNEQTGEKFVAMFNPEEYSLNKDNNYASQAIPGLTSPLIQFVHGNLQTLDMELFFDTFDAQDDVRDETSQIFNLLAINSDLHTPPVLQVTWGSLDFRCVLAKVSQKFIRFYSDGRPGRARLTVTFNEYLDAATQVAQANLQSPDFTKAYTVRPGDTLSGIAANFYEDATLWRPIALANAIVNPRSITAGQEIQIPPLPYTDPSTGVVLS